MKFTLVLIAILGVATSKSHRHYYPEENDPYRVKTLLYKDNSGNIRNEDLTQRVPAPRASVTDVMLYLITKSNRDNPEEIPAANFEALIESKYYDPKKLTTFIIHGWTNDKDSPINKDLPAALLSQGDINVFVVDWSKIAKLDYIRAMLSVRPIGEVVGNFINQMMEFYKLSGKKFSMIGHSLGAHVVGCAGAVTTEKLDYIIGLDPAGPLFTLDNKSNRIDDGDANFVQIIHTNGGLAAFKSSLGHADYFPNGGRKQPGCGLDLLGMCAHGRSIDYLSESIKKSGFIAHLCDEYTTYVEGECFENPQSHLGNFKIDKHAYGDYYLKTNDGPPYSLV